MYLLDTNICIYLIKKKYKQLQERVEEEEPFNVAISSITVGELEFGIAKSKFPKKNKLAILGFLSSFEIIPLTVKGCEAFGNIRAYLNSKGIPIGPYDLQIASQCLASDLVLVSNNIKELQGVPGLKYENWILDKK